jgi:hypothetical protein
MSYELREVVPVSNELPRLVLPDEVIDPAQPLGLYIVGMAQAGKTTLREILTEAWPGPVLNFSNSNGFRGITAYTLIEAGHCLEDQEGLADVVPRLLSAYDAMSDYTQIESILNGLYEEPYPKETLRSPAVEAVVPIVSEHPVLRSLVNAAGGRYLGKVMSTHVPGKDTPGLTILDARNALECGHKFTSAQVANLGGFVLRCPEEVIVERSPESANMTPGERAARVKMLESRNRRDRSRAAGPMTLRGDFARAHAIHEIIDSGEQLPLETLRQIGFDVASHPNEACIDLATDEIDLVTEHWALPYVFAGMVEAVRSPSRRR